MTSILIADHHAPMRRLLQTVVGALADDIYECGDGQEAVNIFKDLHPDYVLMDIEMNGLDGIQATRQILQLDPNARIIIVTQQNDPAWRAAAASAGACGYVLKENLLDLRRWLQAERERDNESPRTHLPSAEKGKSP